MLANYLKIALRSLWRHRGLSVLTVAGLAIGLAACLLIVEYVWFEKSYDQQSPHAPYIWRIYTENYTNGSIESRDANSHSAIGPTLKAELPEVVDYARVYNARDLAVLLEQAPQLQQKAYAVDEGFLRMFPYRTLFGQTKGALSQPHTVVLTAAAARSYFGNTNPVGRTLRLAGGWFNGLHTVTAVTEDVPSNTHFKFEMLLSYQTLYQEGHEDNWENYWDYNYFQLRPDADPAKVELKLAELNRKYLGNTNLKLRMQSLTDIHLRSDLTYEHEPNGSARMVYFLLAIALVILLIAWINYSNLTTARALTRAREVGLRKTIGAERSQLVGQFLAEAMLANAVAVGIAVVLMQGFGATFDQLTGRSLSTSGFAQSTPFGWTLFMLFLLSVLGSGAYPALVLSGHKPLSMLQGFARTGQGASLRRALVVVQLVCSIVLLVATITIYRQLTFMQRHDLGLSVDQMLILKAPLHPNGQDSLYRTRFDVFKAHVQQLAGIQGLTTSSVVPGDGINAIGGTSNGVYWKKNVTDARQTFYFVYVDPAFMDTYGVRRLAGQAFEGNNPQWRSRYMINRAALKAMGFPSPEAAVGEAIQFGNSGEPGREGAMQIVGVVEDFHIESLKQPTRPTLYICAPYDRMSYYSLKLDARQYQSSLKQLTRLWRELYPESPFEYFFLDQKFDEQYRAEQRFGSLFSLFTGLALLVACLGLFGLAMFSAEQRTKEIGIRKVLGASVASVVALLSADFLKLSLLAILIASPIAWYIMTAWLRDFAYRTNLPWWAFVLSGTLVLGVSLLTVSYQSVKAALMNPVKSLRSE